MMASLRTFLLRLLRAGVRGLARRLSFLIVENRFVEGKFFPLEGSGPNSMIVRSAPPRTRDSDELPVPPRGLWIGYAETAEHYLGVGRADGDTMLEAVEGAVS